MDSEINHLTTFYKVWGWVETNWRKLASLAAVLAFVALVAAFFVYQSESKARTASESLSALRPTPDGAGGVKPVPAEAYLKVAADFAGTKAAEQARLLAGESLFDAGKYGDALAQFEQFQRETPNSQLLPEAIYGRAASLEAQGKLTEAGTVLQGLIAKYPSSTLVSRARLSLARIQIAQKQPEQALRLLEEVSKAEPVGMLASISEVLQQEIRAANPNLAARAPLAAVTNSISIKPAAVATNAPAVKTNKP